MTEEEARRKAEAERVEAEGERVEAEEVRQAQEGAGDTEVSRVDAESEREDTEVSRVDAESDRDLAEEERVRVSLSRREAEKERVVAEESRVDAEERRRSVRLFYTKIAAVFALPLAFVALLPAVVGILYVNSVAKENRKVARSTNNALCSFKTNLEEAVASSQKYLDDVEAGNRPRIQGLTDADIQSSIARQQRAIDSLSALMCEKEASG